jgi:hypothetical protein
MIVMDDQGVAGFQLIKSCKDGWMFLRWFQQCNIKDTACIHIHILDFY